MITAFRRHTLLPLDDCLYALQPTISHLTCSALHRCLQRHGISRLPDVGGDKSKRQRFKRYPISYFHIDIAEVLTAKGKLYLFVGIDRTSKFAFTQLVKKAEKIAAAQLPVFWQARAWRDPNKQANKVHIRVALMSRFNVFGTAEIRFAT